MQPPSQVMLTSKDSTHVPAKELSAECCCDDFSHSFGLVEGLLVRQILHSWKEGELPKQMPVFYESWASQAPAKSHSTLAVTGSTGVKFRFVFDWSEGLLGFCSMAYHSIYSCLSTFELCFELKCHNYTAFCCGPSMSVPFHFRTSFHVFRVFRYIRSYSLRFSAN